MLAQGLFLFLVCPSKDHFIRTGAGELLYWAVLRRPFCPRRRRKVWSPLHFRCVFRFFYGGTAVSIVLPYARCRSVYLGAENLYCFLHDNDSARIGAACFILFFVWPAGVILLRLRAAAVSTPPVPSHVAAGFAAYQISKSEPVVGQ